MTKTWRFEAIGVIHSPYKQKFGIPRQAGLAPSAKAILELFPPYNNPDAVKGLETFSHLWLSFIFHQAISKQWKPSVRPPRLGGNKKMGVFATRSPYRANPLGLSVVQLEQVIINKEGVCLSLSGIDLLDQTPIVDIKPYIQYSDSLPQANSGFAQDKPKAIFTVVFSQQAQIELQQIENSATVEKVIKEILSLDPRPAYKNQQDNRIYRTQLFDFDVHWQIQNKQLMVLALK